MSDSGLSLGFNRPRLANPPGVGKGPECPGRGWEAYGVGEVDPALG